VQEAGPAKGSKLALYRPSERTQGISNIYLSWTGEAAQFG
jgi:hypothetical protein